MITVFSYIYFLPSRASQAASQGAGLGNPAAGEGTGSGARGGRLGHRRAPGPTHGVYAEDIGL